MAKISIIIPYMESDPGKPAVLERLLDSLVGADEIIVVENWKAGYAVPINFGLSQASGDYLLVLNDDLVLTQGELSELCDPDAVTSPTIDNGVQPFWGCAFMIPRWVYEKVGGLDERYRVSYFDDDDYINELRKAGIPMRCKTTVNFHNADGGGRTLHTFSDHNEFFEENKQRFIEKWHHTPQELDQYFKEHGELPND